MNSFEANDNRKVIGKWVKSVTVNNITYYYPFKYKIGRVNVPASEYSMVLRLAEVFLIRAEARAQQNIIDGAKFDINLIRTRAGLGNTTADDKASLLAAILHERQVELFTEWGHRWFDMKRSESLDAIMTPICTQKGGTWMTTAQLYPIPTFELGLNSNLIQNPGYQ